MVFDVAVDILLLIVLLLWICEIESTDGTRVLVKGECVSWKARTLKWEISLVGTSLKLPAAAVIKYYSFVLALANDGGYSITHNGVYDSVAHLFTKLIK